MALLEIEGLSKHFGGLLAINDLAFDVREGMILGIIGPNGAGKTTLYNLITGVYKPSKGRIRFDGEDITHLGTHSIAAKGLLRTFQLTHLFHDMTCLQNVLVAHHLYRQTGDVAQFFGTPKYRREEKTVRKRALEILGQLGLGDLKDILAKNLPHGHQRALAIALAMASRPKLLLLDEPMTGMDETETATMMELIRRLRDDLGVTLVVVEHDMKVIMGLSEHILALNFGSKIAEGPPSEVSTSPEVIEAYLGKEDEI
jgi:branched-chain amino acid transport system ATP-binding protein